MTYATVRTCSSKPYQQLEARRLSLGIIRDGRELSMREVPCRDFAGLSSVSLQCNFTDRIRYPPRAHVGLVHKLRHVNVTMTSCQAVKHLWNATYP